jgi:hypothetical protein
MTHSACVVLGCCWNSGEDSAAFSEWGALPHGVAFITVCNATGGTRRVCRLKRCATVLLEKQTAFVALQDGAVLLLHVVKAAWSRCSGVSARHWANHGSMRLVMGSTFNVRSVNHGTAGGC